MQFYFEHEDIVKGFIQYLCSQTKTDTKPASMKTAQWNTRDFGWFKTNSSLVNDGGTEPIAAYLRLFHTKFLCNTTTCNKASMGQIWHFMENLLGCIRQHQDTNTSWKIYTVGPKPFTWHLYLKKVVFKSKPSLKDSLNETISSSSTATLPC